MHEAVVIVVLLLLFRETCAVRASLAAAAALAANRNHPGKKNRAHYHPHGGAPPEYGRESVRGSRELERIRRFVLGDEHGGGGGGANNDDDERPSSSSAASVLIDGNNVRGFAGFGRLGAVDVTYAVEGWYDRCVRRRRRGVTTRADGTQGTPESVSVVWDGGRGPSASLVRSDDARDDDFCQGDERTTTKRPAVSAAFSGPDCTADDVIVQSCCFLDGLGGRIAVFTSDANLGHRCVLQCREADVGVFHSVYLAWLLEEESSSTTAQNEPGGGLGLSSSYTSVHHRLTEPDFWERDERREQVRQLQDLLESKETTRGERGSDPSSMVIGDVAGWIKQGRPGLSLGRVTKIGSIMYVIDRECF